MRQPNPAANIPLNERIYAMDAKQQAAVSTNNNSYKLTI
jgi:hypothetical protein